MNRTLLFSFLLAIPLAIGLHLYMAGNWYSLFHSYSLGIVFGLTAWILFLATLMLACRIGILERIFGQDRLIAMHRYMALTAILAGFFHVFFKLKFSAEITIQHITGFSSAVIILPISAISLLIMSRSIFDRYALFYRLKHRVRSMIRYSAMKFFHNGLALALAVILLHIIIAPSTSETVVRSYFILLTGIPVLTAWLFHKLIRPRIALKGKVSAINAYSDSLYSVRITLMKKLSIIPGQFAYFRFLCRGLAREEHPLTISGMPEKCTIELLIKKEGNWTKAVSEVPNDTAISLDGPYGKFTLSPSGTMLWIAGGVGITPFIARIRQMKQDNISCQKATVLIWTTRTIKEMPYKQEINAYALQDELFTFIPLHTRESGQSERLDADKVCRELENLKSIGVEMPSLWFCGSLSLQKTVFNGAKKAGLSGRYLFFEEFAV